MNIRQATLSDLDTLVPLFDGYMVFYRQPSNEVNCRSFLSERLVNQEAVVFIATDHDGQGMGFTLLYPTFSSVSQARTFILNDLFVHDSHRKKGVASALMNAACDYGRSMGAVRLGLETEVSNKSAQRLYEKEGWVRNDDHYFYDKDLGFTKY